MVFDYNSHANFDPGQPGITWVAFFFGLRNIVRVRENTEPAQKKQSWVTWPWFWGMAFYDYCAGTHIAVTAQKKPFELV